MREFKKRIRDLEKKIEEELESEEILRQIPEPSDREIEAEMRLPSEIIRRTHVESEQE